MAPTDDFYFGEEEEEHFEADHGFDLSTDGARIQGRLLNIEERVQRQRVASPNPVETDQYAGWVGLTGDELGAASSSLADSLSTLEWHSEEENPKKRRYYESSDNPNALWRQLIPVYLNALLRHDGLGDYTKKPKCAFCPATYADGTSTRIFRCEDCGEFLQCEACVRDRHTLSPLHKLKEWNGEFWTEGWLHRSASGFGEGLGLVYQLGHHGFPCPLPEPRRRLVVLDVGGIFVLDVQYCGCTKALTMDHVAQLMNNAWYPATTVNPASCATYRALEQFRLLAVVGNANAHDFVGCLERMTEPTLAGSVPERYVAFARMARQFNWAKRLKRSGRGHDLSGVAGTAPGELAVRCWACPFAGFNLPGGWELRPEAEKFLDTLVLALDANFRLKNHIRKNERYDPSFGSGLSYFVETEDYKNHLRNYVGETDVSSCIAFAALTQKDTRVTTGLRVSGVGGCVCARHGVVQAQGIGDLQKGERYSNMDYILLSALRYANVKELVLSYDIACQWKQHLLERARKLLEETNLPTNLDDFRLGFGLPVWHAAAHEAKCQVENSLSYLRGVGRTDGEGIERTWAQLNPVSFATKEMGEGNRHDTIDDKIDHINFEKNVRQGETLMRKLIVAIAERDKQTQQFEEMDESLNDNTRNQWSKEIEEWEQDRTKRNPYLIHHGQHGVPSEARILADLKKAELDDLRAGRARLAEGKMTLAGFIKAKLQMEELQDRILSESRSKTLTADRASQLDELRVSFFKKLRTIEQLEETFMPAVVELRAEEEELRDPDLPPPKAEDVRLWLPSELSEDERKDAGIEKLARIESSLRRGQCGDTISSLRARIHAATHLSLFRRSHVIGQRHNTRHNTLWQRIEERKQRDARRYRRAFRAMVALEGPTFAPMFWELKDKDLTNRTEEEESDAAARAKLGRAGGRHVRTEPSLAKKVTRVSWIWFLGGNVEAGEVHDAVRVQWSKARARRDRWTEEVCLLREEMKRVLRSLVSVEEVWRQRASAREDLEVGLAGGLRAYALRQACLYRRIADSFYGAWNISAVAAVQNVVGQDRDAYREVLARSEDLPGDNARRLHGSEISGSGRGSGGLWGEREVGGRTGPGRTESGAVAVAEPAQI
ncbi:hypothetical protein C8F01DRAFT_1083718 [Mycena amicta]|nr:hypothetical protein C8F01DRAFT_1083718 [Mycena amicta]